MNLKYFIVSLNKEKSLDVAKQIIAKDDSLSISPIFFTDKEKIISNENYESYMDVNTINLAYKNNSLLFIKTNQHVSHGISIDDFYNNDICIMNVEEFNLIPECIFNKNDILVIWIDTKNHSNLTHNDMIEFKYFNSFLENNSYLYFLDNEPNISDIVLEYFYGDDQIRKKLLDENN